MDSDLVLLTTGTWTVKVRPAGRKDPWVWEYAFATSYPSETKGVVTWRDTMSRQGGKGTWTASGKYVNIAWAGSTTQETWARPITTAPPKTSTYYAADYYRGPYIVEKPVSDGFIVPAAYALSKPAKIEQGNTLLCWAAGAVSLMKTRGRPVLTVEQLLEKYKASLENGAIIEQNIYDVFDSIGIDVRNMSGPSFTHQYVREKLTTRGHFLVLSGHPGSGMGHTRVVYGVGAPDNDWFNVFDPLPGYGLSDVGFSEVQAMQRVYVGFVK